MKREIITTGDGSTTIRLPEWDECYHSKHGAIQEAYHVFIKNGLDEFESGPISILEIGFGTGLNALISAIEAEQRDLKIHYTAVEAYPIFPEEAKMMNYGNSINGAAEIFAKIHATDWESKESISENFILTKHKMFFQEISFQNDFHLVYFDAFGFRVQPELWSEQIFASLFGALKPAGLLVTYAARTIIRKNMEVAGFTVQKRPGPPGKREMLVARKP